MPSAGNPVDGTIQACPLGPIGISGLLAGGIPVDKFLQALVYVPTDQPTVVANNLLRFERKYLDGGPDCPAQVQRKCWVGDFKFFVFPGQRIGSDQNFLIWYVY